MGEDWHYLFRGVVPEQTAATLQSQDMYQRMRALQQCSTSTLSPDESALAKCAASLNLIERRLAECVVIALIRLTPLPEAELNDAALRSKSDNVREVAMRSLIAHATPALLPVFREGLKDKARFPRFAAAEALGNIARNSEVIELLITTLNHEDHAVANRAAVSLGKLAALKRPETESLRPKMLAALITAFKKHSDANRDDSEWG